MAVVHNAELLDIIVDGGESAKSLQRPGMERLLALVEGKKVQAVIKFHQSQSYLLRPCKGIDV